MKTINVKNGPQNISAIIQGCMRMPALTMEAAAEVIRTAYECGINCFDHATCYGKDGEAEIRFGEAFKLTGLKREDVFIQSKCGICPDLRTPLLCCFCRNPFFTVYLCIGSSVLILVYLPLSWSSRFEQQLPVELRFLQMQC